MPARHLLFLGMYQPLESDQLPQFHRHGDAVRTEHLHDCVHRHLVLIHGTASLQCATSKQARRNPAPVGLRSASQPCDTVAESATSGGCMSNEVYAPRPSDEEYVRAEANDQLAVARTLNLAGQLDTDDLRRIEALYSTGRYAEVIAEVKRLTGS